MRFRLCDTPTHLYYTIRKLKVIFYHRSWGQVLDLYRMPLKVNHSTNHFYFNVIRVQITTQ